MLLDWCQFQEIDQKISKENAMAPAAMAPHFSSYNFFLPTCVKTSTLPIATAPEASEPLAEADMVADTVPVGPRQFGHLVIIWTFIWTTSATMRPKKMGYIAVHDVDVSQTWAPNLKK